MEGDVQSQSAPAASEALAAGTADQAMDAGVSTGASTEATTPVGTDGDASSTAAAEAANSEASSSETSEQRTSRRDRQRDKRAAPAPAPEPAKTPAQIIAEHEATQRATYEAQQRQYQEAMRYARYVGDDPAEPNNPQSQTKYQKLWAEAHVEISKFPEGGTYEDLEKHNAKIEARTQALAKIEELDGRRKMLQDVRTPAEQHARVEARTWLGNEIEAGLSDLGLPPQEIIAQITDPQQAIRSIVKSMGDRVRATVTAELQPKIDDLEEDLAAALSEVDTWKRRAGGEAAQPLRGGIAGRVGKTTLQDLLSQPDYAERAMRGEFSNLDLSG